MVISQVFWHFGIKRLAYKFRVDVLPKGQYDYRGELNIMRIIEASGHKVKGCSFSLILLSLSVLPVLSQEYCGTTGLIAVPTAETAEAGTFRGGAFFLNDHFTPEKQTCDDEKYNTGGYFISLTPWSWLEVSYACTLLKFHKNNNPKEKVGYYNEDRRLSLKLRPLKEGKWWPAIAVGADDVEQFIERWFDHKGGTYFHNAYIVASKSVDIGKHELSAHLGYRYFFKDVN